MAFGTPVNSAIAGSTSAATPAVPDGAIGDLIVWCIAWGIDYTGTSYPTEASRPTLTGNGAARATYVGTARGGVDSPGEAWGVDTGKRLVSWWIAEATAATGTTDAVTFNNAGSGTNRMVAGYAFRVSKGAGTTVATALTSGEDNTKASAWSPTGFAAISAQSGDLLMSAFLGVPVSVNIAPTVTWTGLTLDTLTGDATAAVTAGHDLRLNVRRINVTAGSVNSAPSVSSATTGAAGAQSILRLREVAPSAVMNAGPDQSGIEPGQVVTLTSAASTGSTARTWTQVSGTAVTLSSTTATSPTFTAPPTLAGTTLRFRVTDNASGNWDEVDIAVLASSRRVKVGGTMVPTYRRVYV